jgi:hypothetical protein
MRSRFATALVTLALISPASSLAQTDHSKVIGKFVGTWTENESKRKLGSGIPGLRFRNGTNGSLEELRGPEARPLVQPVKFGTDPYAIDNGKNTIAWKQIDAMYFERKLFENGKLITTRQIVVSPDGNKLREVTKRFSTDGKEMTETVIYQRSSGSPQGLVGIWKPESIRSSEPAQEKIEAVGSNGLRLKGRTGNTVTWDFTGKPQPAMGPGTISGTTDTAKILNDNAIEVTASREGIATNKTILVVSDDGKSLTATTTSLGRTGGQPSVTVFEKR